MTDIRTDVIQLIEESKSARRPVVQLREALKHYVEARTEQSMDNHIIEFAADYNDIDSKARSGKLDKHQYIQQIAQLVQDYIDAIQERRTREERERRKRQQANAQTSLFGPRT